MASHKVVDIPASPEADREARTRYIGGHDAAAIVGLSPWDSPTSVFMKKKKLIPSVPADPEAAAMGLLLEPVILQLYAQRTRSTLRKGFRIVDATHDFFAGSPDGYVVPPGATEIVGGVDAKAVDPFVSYAWGKEDAGGDGVPEHLQVQAQWYMGIDTRAPHWDVAALFGARELRIYRIPRDAEAIGWLREECLKFHTDHILKNVPPPIDGHEATTKALGAHFQRQTQAPILANPEIDALAKSLPALKAAAKAAEVEVERVKNMIRAFAGEAEGVAGDGWRATYKAQEAKRFDVKAAKAAAQSGDPMAQAALIRFVSKSPSRPLRFYGLDVDSED